MEPCNMGGASVVSVCVCRGVWQMQAQVESKMPSHRRQLCFFLFVGKFSNEGNVL